MAALRAEWRKVVSRPIIWGLLLACMPLLVAVRYWLGYSRYRQARQGLIEATAAESWVLQTLLPIEFAQQAVSDVNLVGAAGAAVVAVLVICVEPDSGTLDLTLTQGPRRGEVLAAKATVLVAILALALAASFVMAAGASSFIALLEGEPFAFPAVTFLLTGYGFGLVILVACAALGILVAQLLPSTGLAMAVVLVYVFAVQGPSVIFSEISDAVAFMAQFLVWPNGATLLASLRPNTIVAGVDIPVWRALLTLNAYTVISLFASYALLQRRDVS